MGSIINASIRVDKLPKEKFIKGKDGAVYYNLTISVNDETRYGNNVAITDSQTKEEREGGQKLPILDNFKLPMANHTKVQTEINPKVNMVAKKAPQPMDLDDDLPF